MIKIIIGLVFVLITSLVLTFNLYQQLQAVERSNAQCQQTIESGINIINELSDVGVDEWLRDNDLYRSDTVPSRTSDQGEP